MTRELKFTSANFNVGTDDDSCYLDPNDPVHEFMITGNASNLNKPKQISVVEPVSYTHLTLPTIYSV